MFYMKKQKKFRIKQLIYLVNKLLRYIVPNYYVKIYKIPLSRTGKLGRKELSEPVKGVFIIEEYVAPETKVEKIICKIYNKMKLEE